MTLPAAFDEGGYYKMEENTEAKKAETAHGIIAMTQKIKYFKKRFFEAMGLFSSVTDSKQIPAKYFEERRAMAQKMMNNTEKKTSGIQNNTALISIPCK